MMTQNFIDVKGPGEVKLITWGTCDAVTRQIAGTLHFDFQLLVIGLKAAA